MATRPVDCSDCSAAESRRRFRPPRRNRLQWRCPHPPAPAPGHRSRRRQSCAAVDIRRDNGDRDECHHPGPAGCQFLDKPPRDPRAYLKAVDEIYVNDAYHSLSIEGYRVSPDLIERVRSGTWNPDENPRARENLDALAARGYYDAFVSVKASVEKVLAGTNAGAVSQVDHRDWHRQLFGPSFTAGIVRAADLAGYRTGPVYIRRSMHVPPRREAVRDCMPVLFELLANETEPAVRVVLGHFVFVYIHPYVDGKGRMGRFLMNVMLASGGQPWTIIPLERSDDYMPALEAASVRQDIRPFARFVGGLVDAGLHGRTAPSVPAGGAGERRRRRQ